MHECPYNSLEIEGLTLDMDERVFLEDTKFYFIKSIKNKSLLDLV